mgnify:CR=1 FL=1
MVFSGNKGVVCWEGVPVSPKKILPEPSSWKHIENEFVINPDLARELGSEISPNPNPRRPFGAPPLRKAPDWFCAHL